MAYIKPEFIEKIESRVDIVAIIGNFVKLKKAGSVYQGLSPWTAEKSPSFTVSPVKEIFKDFSSGKGGNVIHFLMEHKGWTYPEAIEYLAEQLNMPMEYEENVDVEKLVAKKEKQVQLSAVVQSTINYYHRKFLELADDHPAKLEVYGKRGYTEEQVKTWEIGFAAGNKELYAILLDRGIVVPGEESGVIKNGNDRFWNRVIYPIYDERNKAIGIAGRDISGDKKAAKWINPADTELYDKSKVLYGMNVAREHIYKLRTAYLVEGYNDVIAWHTRGILNTVSASGTAITHDQLQYLRKQCNRITLCMDGDGAGLRAMLKAIPECLELGFTVRVLLLPGCDPDDFVRLYAESIAAAKDNLPGMLAEECATIDGFGLLMKHALVGDDIQKAQAARELCEVIHKVGDDATAKIYVGWLSKQSTFTKTEISRWVLEHEEKKPVTKTLVEGCSLPPHERYILPKKVTTPLADLIPTIEQYQMFQSDNQIFVQANDDPPFFFKSVSNFSISIVQHMNDEKFPMKLLHIKNVRNDEKIFDVPSADINTPQQFDKAMTDQGNFFFEGSRQDLQKLRAYLYDSMGSGRKIDVPGQQPENFWCWNNKVRLEDGTPLQISDNGIVKVDGVSYYIPSANKIYANNPFRYDAQKRFSVFQSPVSFQTYTELMLDVHGDHAITGLLFTMASFFQDIIVGELGNFPILFLYGPASTGKDQLMECCQSFFGKPQTAINLEGGASTIKANIREFAQFSNSMGHLSEYKRGNPQQDGIIKGLWDRRGYKRGNIESHVGTESIPILSSVGMTGNDYPDNEALITRLIPEDMVRTQFNDAEVEKFEKLRDIISQGISSLGDEFLVHRQLFKKQFQKKFRMFKQGFSDKLPNAKSRMISNLSVLGATYHIFQDVIIFPFDHNRMTDHFVKITEAQMRRLESASVITKWWDCFLASMRGSVLDSLRLNKDYKIENGTLSFNFTNAYNKVSRQWYLQYRELAPSKSETLDKLRKDHCYVCDKKSERIGDTNTSAVMINLEYVDIKEEINNAMIWQMNEKTLFNQDEPPATPDSKKDEHQADLPF